MWGTGVVSGSFRVRRTTRVSGRELVASVRQGPRNKEPWTKESKLIPKQERVSREQKFYLELGKRSRSENRHNSRRTQGVETVQTISKGGNLC